ncbi:hypothetical protein B0A52_08247 [Exophiala mesophila]|uniref:F-box domain-containing protein n=1 Tax=Exophiala mesophila TaxID=212818 RepID=A0A438MWH7_EXOME|nr:hypothetical protein B0A52_08247 [Exophiala mesophila]
MSRTNAINDDNSYTMTLQSGNSDSWSCFFPLPREILLIIYNRLTHSELGSLRATCKAATEIVDLEMDIKRAHSRRKASLLAEEKADYALRQRKYENYSRWARPNPNEYRTYYSSDTISNLHKNYITRAERLNCYSCLTTLPRECFGDKQITGSKSLGHKDARLRFCMACGLKKGFYLPGTVFKMAMKSCIVCKGCNSIQRGDPFHRAKGVCSPECLDKIQLADMVTGARDSTPIKTTNIQGPNRHEGCALARTRANRCLRCWGINHTERPADGTSGTRLCRSCEVDRDGDSIA